MGTLVSYPKVSQPNTSDAKHVLSEKWKTADEKKINVLMRSSRNEVPSLSPFRLRDGLYLRGYNLPETLQLPLVGWRIDCQLMDSESAGLITNVDVSIGREKTFFKPGTYSHHIFLPSNEAQFKVVVLGANGLTKSKEYELESVTENEFKLDFYGHILHFKVASCLNEVLSKAVRGLVDIFFGYSPSRLILLILYEIENTPLGDEDVQKLTEELGLGRSRNDSYSSVQLGLGRSSNDYYSSVQPVDVGKLVTEVKQKLALCAISNICTAERGSRLLWLVIIQRKITEDPSELARWERSEMRVETFLSLLPLLICLCIALVSLPQTSTVNLALQQFVPLLPILTAESIGKVVAQLVKLFPELQISRSGDDSVELPRNNPSQSEALMSTLRSEMLATLRSGLEETTARLRSDVLQQVKTALTERQLTSRQHDETQRPSFEDYDSPPITSLPTASSSFPVVSSTTESNEIDGRQQEEWRAGGNLDSNNTELAIEQMEEMVRVSLQNLDDKSLDSLTWQPLMLKDGICCGYKVVVHVIDSSPLDKATQKVNSAISSAVDFAKVRRLKLEVSCVASEKYSPRMNTSGDNKTAASSSSSSSATEHRNSPLDIGSNITVTNCSPLSTAFTANLKLLGGNSEAVTQPAVMRTDLEDEKLTDSSRCPPLSSSASTLYNSESKLLDVRGRQVLVEVESGVEHLSTLGVYVYDKEQRKHLASCAFHGELAGKKKIGFEASVTSAVAVGGASNWPLVGRPIHFVASCLRTSLGTLVADVGEGMADVSLIELRVDTANQGCPAASEKIWSNQCVVNDVRKYAREKFGRPVAFLLLDSTHHRTTELCILGQITGFWELNRRTPVVGPFLQVTCLRTVSGSPIQFLKGSSGCRVYSPNGFLGTHVGGVSANEAFVCPASFSFFQAHLRSFHFCAHNNSDEKVTHLLQHLENFSTRLDPNPSEERLVHPLRAEYSGAFQPSK